MFWKNLTQRYDAEVMTCDVHPALSGGVFEPNSQMIVVVRNGGGLPELLYLPHQQSSSSSPIMISLKVV